MEATTQQTVLAAVAVCQFVAFVVAGLVAYHQARSHIGLRRLQSTLAIVRYVESLDITYARWFAYEHHEQIDAELEKHFNSEFERLNAIDSLIKKLSGGELNIHKYLFPVVALNVAGYLIENHVEEDIISALLASTFLRTWEAYKRFIEYRRVSRFMPDEKLPPTKYAHYLENIVNRIGLKSS